MMIRTCVVCLSIVASLVAGCEGKKKSDPAAEAGETATAPAPDLPPAQPGAETAPTGGDTAADPAKVDEAANTALKIMAVVSSAVRGAKGDCARMGQNLTGVMTVAQKWRDQLAEQYTDAAVKAGVKAGLAAGKFPELKTNIDDTRSGAKACPDAAPEFEKVLAEIE